MTATNKGHTLSKTGGGTGWYTAAAKGTQPLSTVNRLSVKWAEPASGAATVGFSRPGEVGTALVAWGIETGPADAVWIVDNNSFSIALPGSTPRGPYEVAIEGGEVRYYIDGALVHTSVYQPPEEVILGVAVYFNGDSATITEVDDGAGAGGGPSLAASMLLTL